MNPNNNNISNELIGVDLGNVFNNAGIPKAPTDLGATGGPTAPVLLSNRNYQNSNNFFSLSKEDQKKFEKEKELAKQEGIKYYESLKQDETLALFNLIQYHQHLYNLAVILNDIEKQKGHSNSYYFFLGQLNERIKQLEFLESKSGIPQKAPIKLTSAQEIAEQTIELNRSLEALRRSYNKSKSQEKGPETKGGFSKNESKKLRKLKNQKTKKSKKSRKNK